MNGSPPKIPKKLFPIFFASAIVRLAASSSILCCFEATSTQQPWHRRLQLLITDRYRNGGKNSPRLSRRLWRWTLHRPFAPKVQAAFHSSRLSVSNSRRRAMRRYIQVGFGSGEGRATIGPHYDPSCHRVYPPRRSRVGESGVESLTAWRGGHARRGGLARGRPIERGPPCRGPTGRVVAGRPPSPA